MPWKPLFLSALYVIPQLAKDRRDYTFPFQSARRASGQINPRLRGRIPAVVISGVVTELTLIDLRYNVGGASASGFTNTYVLTLTFRLVVLGSEG